MKDIKITLTHDSLKVIVNSLKHFHYDADSDCEKIIASLKDDLLLRLHKKLLEGRQQQKIKFKTHEAIALRHLLAGCSYIAADSYEENELRININHLDHQLP